MHAGAKWINRHSVAVVRMMQRKYTHSLISGADGHQGSRGHGPHLNTSQNVVIQERFLFSLDYLLQQTPTTNPNADRQAIPASVAPNANSNERLQ